jgi:hypothetical protein
VAAVLAALLIGIMIGLLLRPVVDAYLSWKTARMYADLSDQDVFDEQVFRQHT